MKLLRTQYQDIIEILKRFTIDKEHLTLKKRKGRIVISLHGIESTFEFIKRKSVALSELDQDWHKLEHYEVTFSGNHVMAGSWEEVVPYLTKWIQECKG